jgi:hypothetical protein
MSVDCEIRPRAARGLPTLRRNGAASRRRRLACLALTNLLLFSACGLLAEIGFRLFWSPKYWVHTGRLWIGSGQTEAGKKWWPDTTYAVDSSEFHVLFRTNEEGYRARPTPSLAACPFRVAFVGDSFTEGMQVPYESTFCARIEDLLNQKNPARPLVCENNGVSATDLFEYWHRITHDVLNGSPPDALVLCIYPGNDFQGLMPDQAFDQHDCPRRDYFKKASLKQHVIAWINLHSKVGSFLQRAIFSIGGIRTTKPRQGPKNWWSKPEVAALAHDDIVVRRCRSLFRAIDQECRRIGTKLCVLVVGPVGNYAAEDGQSPLTRILTNWGLEIPVIDLAIQAIARPDHSTLTFPIDGHLTESGHAFIARQAAPGLEAFLKQTALTGAQR